MCEAWRTHRRNNRLVAPGAEGYAIVDVKTSDCDADMAARKADQYAPQRAAYSQAVEAIVGAPVRRSDSNSQGWERLWAGRDDEDRPGTRRAIDFCNWRGRVARVDAISGRVRFCGYKEAGWCEGAKEA